MIVTTGKKKGIRMQVQRCNNCQANPNFTALYINPDKIEKTIGKRYAQHAINAIPKLEKLAKDVDIRVLPYFDMNYPKKISSYGFQYIISKIEPEQPKIKNPIKRFFHDLFMSEKMPNVEKKMYFDLVPDEEPIADYIVKEISRLKDNFVKLGGMD